MIMQNAFLVSTWVVVATLVSSCTKDTVRTSLSEPVAVQPSERPFKRFTLPQPAAQRENEYSGLAWYQDRLILLPQYPDAVTPDPVLYSATKDALVKHIQEGFRRELSLSPIKVKHLKEVENKIAGFQGFEAIAFMDDTAYLLVEAENKKGQMAGFLVKGTIDLHAKTLNLHPQQIVEVPIPVELANMAHETLLVDRHELVVIFEANGRQVNPKPIAYRFSRDLKPLGTLPFPNIEYRITDATEIRDGSFWAINYLYQGDRELLKPSNDSYRRFDKGPTHQKHTGVERLIHLKYDRTGIRIIESRPVYFELGDKGRNWEGLAYLDGYGFIVVTDKHPETILGFLPH